MIWSCRLASLAGALFLFVAGSGDARADQASATIALANLEAGRLAAGDRALSAIIERDPADNDARFGLGATRFVRAIEHLSQGLYRYGLKTPDSGFVPILRLPVPENPQPQPITYEAFRALLQSFVDDLGSANDALALMSPVDVKLKLDLAKLRYDADGDGRVGDDERLITIINKVTGARLSGQPVVGFDRGDAYWLQGYCQVLMSFADFLLAHDFQETFNDTFHLVFPSTQLPLAAALAAPGVPMSGADEIADLISFVHLVNWPVVDAKRMAGIRLRLKDAVALSRKSWTAIEAETDDDREWIPNPRQNDSVTGHPVEAQQIASWRAVLDQMDAALDGKALIPHWRLERGINLRRVFDEPRPFDLVLWITGPAALPYLEDGRVITAAGWLGVIDAFHGDFATYLVWFN